MNVNTKHMSISQDLGINKGEKVYVRKPYQRKSRKLEGENNSKVDNDVLKLQINDLKELKQINPAKNRKKIERKIANLIELGLIPDLPRSKLVKFKKHHRKSIMISDFMKKSSQKQILSFHNFTNTIQKTHDSSDKEKLPTTYSFSVGLPSTRNSQSFQALPQLRKESLSLNDDFKQLRDVKLKKIDQIMSSCTRLLNSSHKKHSRLISQMPLTDRSSL